MKLIFCLFALFLSLGGAYGQEVSKDRVATYTSILEITRSAVLENLDIKKTEVRVASKSIPHIQSASLVPTAFFCRIEEKFERSARFPVRMRIGDIDFVNWMEGKSNYRHSSVLRQ